MSKEDFKFSGFEQSNTTPVPDILFDELLSELSGSELKVLLYIIRRTKGFKKDTDAISLTQFEKGIVTSSGKVLDKGCGLNRETICKALVSLEKKGCIKSEKRVTKHGDNAVTLYSIRFRGDEVVGKSDQCRRKNEPPKVVGKSAQGSRKKSTKIEREVVGKSDPQETEQETVLASRSRTNQPSLTLSPEEQSFYDLWAQKPFSVVKPKVTVTLKDHCATLAPHVHTKELLLSLFTFARTYDHVPADKPVELGNLVNSLNGWLQVQSQSSQSPRSSLSKMRDLRSLTQGGK